MLIGLYSLHNEESCWIVQGTVEEVGIAPVLEPSSMSPMTRQTYNKRTRQNSLMRRRFCYDRRECLRTGFEHVDEVLHVRPRHVTFRDSGYRFQLLYHGRFPVNTDQKARSFVSYGFETSSSIRKSGC